METTSRTVTGASPTRCARCGRYPTRAPAAPVPARLAEDAHRSRDRTLETEHEPEKRRLAAAVRPGDRDELSGADLERDVLEDANAGPVAERDAVELDDRGGQGLHPSAFCRAARFDRMTEK